jgi:ATP-dependent Clp protease ATP-binding subunit ClpA
MASFSSVLEETIHRALTLATDRKHELATLEHLLLALLEDKDAVAVITACDVDIEPLRADVKNYLDEDLSSLRIEILKRQDQRQVSIELFSEQSFMFSLQVEKKLRVPMLWSHCLLKGKAMLSIFFKKGI